MHFIGINQEQHPFPAECHERTLTAIIVGGFLSFLLISWTKIEDERAVEREEDFKDS